MKIYASISLIFMCIAYVLVHDILIVNGDDVNPNKTDDRLKQCRLQMAVDNYLNFLTPIDVVATNSDTNIACIKARFSLAITLEFIDSVVLDEDGYDDVGIAEIDKVILNENGTKASLSDKGKRTMYYRKLLGYLPMEKYIYVEQTCPEFIKPKQVIDSSKTKTTTSTTTTTTTTTSTTTTTTTPRPIAANSNMSPAILSTKSIDDNKVGGDSHGCNQQKEVTNDLYESDDELEMIVTFECGKMAFTFRRDDNSSYLASIKGNVQFDSELTRPEILLSIVDARQVRDFSYTKPTLLTSGSNYHFKYNDLIQIRSESEDDNWLLTANLYLMEIETFRNTTNRDFIEPPDEKSKPYLNEPELFNLTAAVDKLRSKQA